ncbi:MAG: response regulator [Cyanobacteria bacterium P01_G01_bin.19]
MREEKNYVVLAIDDNQDNLLLMDLILSQDGYWVEKACSGKEGIAKIHALIPDLIILDLMMPDMTGLEVIKAIKAHPHLSQIPVLICTANVQAKKIDLLPADSVCYKPFDIDDMLFRVKSLITYYDRVGNSTSVSRTNCKSDRFYKHQSLAFKTTSTLEFEAIQKLMS